MAPLRALADLALPPRCPACGQPSTATWCGACLGRLAALALPDRGLVTLAQRVVAVAAYSYEGVARDTLLDVKLRHRRAPVAVMGLLMRARLGLPAAGGGCASTWVPSQGRRVRARGVDVARVLAGPGAVPLLRRTRVTADQKHLPASLRRTSQRDAFEATAPVPRAVVLVDDIRTTGATALAAATALRRAGARRVLVATFAAVADPDR
jgi:predicted amidophosphoribosyltransferase